MVYETFSQCFLQKLLDCLKQSFILTWVGLITRMGESKGAYKVLMGKPEGRRALERPRHR
jgi:hypothetical protein